MGRKYYLKRGDKFGKLMVLGKSKDDRNCYLCACECGVEENIRTTKLINGERTCCRQCQKDHSRDKTVKTILGEFEKILAYCPDKCIIANCDKPYLCKGLCANHYHSWYGMNKRNGIQIDDYIEMKGIKVNEKYI